MAKKLNSLRPGPETSGSGEAPITLAQAIREALEALGVEATKSDVLAWLRDRYPQIVCKEATLNTVLSMRRQDARHAEEESWLSGEDTPTVEDLKLVKELVDNHGGIRKMAALLKEVADIVEEIGGPGKLRAAVVALKRLSL